MTRTAAWVLGRGGLLGSALARVLPELLPQVEEWRPSGEGFSWRNGDLLQDQLDRAAAQFEKVAAAEWMILWCAGSGGMGSTAEEMEEEFRTFRDFLDLLGRRLKGRPGSMLLTSSAGGIHPGPGPVTESSPPAPESDYGRTKLREEELARAWAAARPGVSLLIARLSNLYGPGQNLAKAQGLISHAARSVLLNRPLHVYVPLDTQRDLLFVEDAARALARAMGRLAALDPARSVLKIFAAERSVSVAHVLSLLSRVAKRPPRVVCGADAKAKAQPASHSFRSEVWRDLAAPRTDLASGLHAVCREQLRLLTEGRLKPA